jgi:hypothetical protein
MATRDWRIAGQELGNCNCAWGCPCQFNALPTYGRCYGFTCVEIHEGHLDRTRLEGVRFAGLYGWPGAIHEGNGSRWLIIDERATPEQRNALETIESGEVGGIFFEVFSSMCPNRAETAFAPIELEIDREAGVASARIPGIVDARTEPIRNPVTGEEHRARIVIPRGFEFTEADVVNTVSFSSTAPDPGAAH